MGLIQKYINIKLTPYNIDYYIQKGYKVDGYNDILTINVFDLPNGSGINVLVWCDYCGRIFQKSWRRYLETKNDTCCKYCKSKKFMKTNTEKYGVSCTLNYPEIKSKKEETFMRKYGTKSPLGNIDIYRKTRSSFYDKSKDVSVSICTSSQQRHIMNLYGAELNKLVGIYFVDGYIDEYNMYIEYDGSGHRLPVKMGIITNDEYDKREKLRSDYLISCGLKEFRIVCEDDKLPSDDELIEIKYFALENIKQGHISCSYNTISKQWTII